MRQQGEGKEADVDKVVLKQVVLIRKRLVQWDNTRVDHCRKEALSGDIIPRL